VRAAATLGAVALLAAGCGGGTATGRHPMTSEYEAKLRNAGLVLSDGLAATSVISTRPSSRQAIESEGRQARARLQAAALELKNAKPPKEAVRNNTEIVAGLTFLRDEIAGYARAAAAHDWRSINRLNQAQARSQTLDAAYGALEDLKRKGYKVAFSGTGSSSISGGISCSSDTVTAPNVIGEREQAAVRHLRAAGLDATVFPQIKPNPHVPAGVVVHESPLDFPLCKGTPVWIIVSIGT